MPISAGWIGKPEGSFTLRAVNMKMHVHGILPSLSSFGIYKIKRVLLQHICFRWVIYNYNERVTISPPIVPASYKSHVSHYKTLYVIHDHVYFQLIQTNKNHATIYIPTHLRNDGLTTTTAVEISSTLLVLANQRTISNSNYYCSLR